jgi:hypothetical protein
MIKIGDGVKLFRELDWLYAKAADVHEWAKLSLDDFVDLFEGLETHTGDDEITHTRTASGGKITCSTTHAPHASFEGATLGGTITGAHKGSFDIVVPKLEFNEYGHLIAGADKTYTITLPDVPTYKIAAANHTTNDVDLKLSSDNTPINTVHFVGESLIDVKYKTGDAGQVVFSHATPSGSAGGTAGGSETNVVYSVTTDDKGHVTGKNAIAIKGDNTHITVAKTKDSDNTTDIIKVTHAGPGNKSTEHGSTNKTDTTVVYNVEFDALGHKTAGASVALVGDNKYINVVKNGGNI